MKSKHADHIYIELLEHIMTNGVQKTDRTGTGTKSVFGYQMRFDLSDGFPLLTTKKLHLKSIIYELLWFLRGDTNIKWLNDNGVTIWDEWADGNGDLGPVYGSQWRKWEGADGAIYDQITDLIKMIRKNPDSRRLIVSAWKVEEINKMKLPPCHCLFQFETHEATQIERIQWANARGILPRTNALMLDLIDGTEEDFGAHTDIADAPSKVLSCQLYQRSCDTFLGVPFNIASYALFTEMIAQVCNLIPGEFVWTGGDVHIYNNHFAQVAEQISRRNSAPPMPQMLINSEVKEIDDFKFEDFKLENYSPLPGIKAPIAV